MNTSVKASRFEHHIDIRQGGVKALDWLVGQSPLDAYSAEQLVAIGAVWLTRGQTERLRDTQMMLKYGDQLHIYYDEDILAMSPLEPTLISDQGSYSIWFKPSGMRGEGTRYGDHCSLLRWVERYFDESRSVELIYRLERTISGLIVISHDTAVTAALQVQFQQGTLRLDYRAWVAGLPHFNHQVLDEPVRGKTAKTLVTTLKQAAAEAQTLVAIRLETGRKHQVRQHLSAVGHPVIGDRLFGQCREDNLQLQLTEIHFICPVAQQWQHLSVPDKFRIDINDTPENAEISAASA